MSSKTFSPILLMLFFFASCSNSTTIGDKKEAAIENNTVSSSGNFLTMKINGKEWKADSEIFAAFHPEGYNNAILIAGSKGPKDKNEQAFNLNLYKTTGPGIFQFANGNAENSVIQLANLSEEHFMYGSMMGFTVKVNVTKASKNPTIVEATFEGELTGNASDKIVITEGKFYYHE